MTAFKRLVGENIQGIELQQKENMNKVPISFYMPLNFTIDKNGNENIKMDTTGSEKCNFTGFLFVIVVNFPHLLSVRCCKPSTRTCILNLNRNQ